ncbi:Acid phosphatase [Cytospora mali]|uniref:Purple acid phosphatase n=1 Tax=Cytospora mali TaxID=578113 RepID=A0A194VMU3_CYTMA|nr:Acid phosphatase [Valsa mali]
MRPPSNAFKGLPLLAYLVLADANYPSIPSDLTTPVQARLAISGANSVSVGWNTYEELDKPCVKYGTSSNSLNKESCSNISVTYNTSRTWSNTVILNDLTAGTTYYYKIVSTNSTVESFMSPRTPGDKTPFTTSVVIDLGVYGADGYTIKGDMSKRDTIPTVDPSLNHTTIGRLADNFNEYEWVLHPGDFGYADDWYLNPDNVLDGTNAYEAILEEFYNQLSPISSRKVYMASPGNHEADCEELGTLTIEAVCPEGQKNFTDFRVRFGQNMPTAFGSTSSNNAAKVNANKAKMLANPPFWYSFEYGMVHVTMIDTETDFTNAPDLPYGSSELDGGNFGYTGQQVDFFEADLASVDRTVTPWLIVAGHRPWYSTGGRSNICSACQDAFEPLMYKYGVDLGVFGHVHNSQRFAPVNNSIVDPAGMDNPKSPMYIIAGGAGNIEGATPVGSNISSNRFAYAEDFAYATLTFADENNLEINFLRSSTGEILDTSTLYKSHTKQFVVQ